MLPFRFILEEKYTFLWGRLFTLSNINFPKDDDITLMNFRFPLGLLQKMYNFTNNTVQGGKANGRVYRLTVAPRAKEKGKKKRKEDS